MTRVLLVFAILLGAVGAGCIAPEQDSSLVTPPINSGGEMSAKESREDKAEVCPELTGDVTKGAQFCATRVIRVDGTISGLPKLSLDVATFNGAIDFTSGAGNAFSLVATLKARGTTEADAKSNLDAIDYAWSHVDGGSHFIQALAKTKSSDGNNGRAASIQLEVPSSITYVIVASTSNGAVHVKDLKTDGLAAHTSNGAIDLNVDATQVEATTSNGAISGTLKSSSSGRFVFTTSNGKIDVKVPEDNTRGYDAEATTSNGKVDITLTDGKKGDCPAGSQYYTPPCNHRTFTTHAYNARAIQTRIVATSSNGEISLSPS